MALHLIPEDDSPHSPMPECDCGPVLLGDNRTYAHAGTEAYNLACTSISYALREAEVNAASLRAVSRRRY